MLLLGVMITRMIPQNTMIPSIIKSIDVQVISPYVYRLAVLLILLRLSFQKRIRMFLVVALSVVYWSKIS